MSDEDYDAIAHRVLADWEAKQAREAGEKAREDDRRVLSGIAGFPFWVVVVSWICVGAVCFLSLWSSSGPLALFFPAIISILLTLQHKMLAPLAREVNRLHAEIAELKSGARETEVP